MKKIYFFIPAICLLIQNSCKQEEPFSLPKPVIEPDFQQYVDRFRAEAVSRGFIVDLSRLKVGYGDTLKHYCWLTKPNNVIIKSSCWEACSDVQKEILLFRELGGAVLQRTYDDSKLPNGDFKSIMNQTPFYLYNESTPERRKYYLDELFVRLTPPPGWAAIKTKPTIIFKDTIQSGSPRWQFVNQTGNTFIGKFCSTQYFSHGTSLSIEQSNDLQGWAKWQLNYIPQGINQSDKLVLSAKIKTIGVTKGGGATIWIGGFDVNNAIVTSGFKTDSGTMDYTEWKAEWPYYFPGIKSIQIKLVLDRSQGIVYFDDVTLTKYE